MKKAVIGFILGVALTVTGSAYAEEINNMIGKAIGGQFPVKIDGKQLPVQAIVVEGTSYLPVRAIGDALNLDVKFDADLGIELSEKEATTMTTQQITTMTPEDQETITRVEGQISTSQKRIEENNTKIAEIEKQIQEAKQKMDSLPEGDDKTYQYETWKNLNENKRMLEEDNIMHQDGITSQQTYIEKIKAKYTTP